MHTRTDPTCLSVDMLSVISNSDKTYLLVEVVRDLETMNKGQFHVL